MVDRKVWVEWHRTIRQSVDLRSTNRSSQILEAFSFELLSPLREWNGLFHQRILESWAAWMGKLEGGQVSHHNFLDKNVPWDRFRPKSSSNFNEMALFFREKQRFAPKYSLAIHVAVPTCFFECGSNSQLQAKNISAPLSSFEFLLLLWSGVEEVGREYICRRARSGKESEFVKCLKTVWRCPSVLVPYAWSAS